MLSMKIIHIEEYEADVLVSDKDNELLCFCSGNLNELQNLSIHTFLSKNIFKTEDRNERAIKLSDYYSYKLFCKVSDCEKCLVTLGEFKIFLDSPLPSDIKNNDFVEFDVMRLDIF